MPLSLGSLETVLFLACLCGASQILPGSIYEGIEVCFGSLRISVLDQSLGHRLPRMLLLAGVVHANDCHNARIAFEGTGVLTSVFTSCGLPLARV